MPLVRHICKHQLSLHHCSSCGQSFLSCDFCHPGQVFCDPCKPLQIDYPSLLPKFYRSIKQQKERSINSQNRLAKIRSKIRKERGIHIFPSGERFTQERWEKRRKASFIYCREHAEEKREYAKERYHSNIDLYRARSIESYYRNPRNPETRKNYREKNRDKINANRREYYANNRDHILACQKARRSDPKVRDHDNLLRKIARIKRVLGEEFQKPSESSINSEEV